MLLESIFNIDKAFMFFWSKVLAPLRRLTGQDNFFFTRLFAGVGGGGLASLALVLLVADAHRGVFFDLFLLLAIALSLYLMWLIMGIAGRLETAYVSGQASLGFVHQEARKVCLVRILGSFLVIAGFLHGDWLSTGLVTILMAAFYFVLDFELKIKGRAPQLRPHPLAN